MREGVRARIERAIRQINIRESDAAYKADRVSGDTLDTDAKDYKSSFSYEKCGREGGKGGAGGKPVGRGGGSPHFCRILFSLPLSRRVVTPATRVTTLLRVIYKPTAIPRPADNGAPSMARVQARGS